MYWFEYLWGWTTFVYSIISLIIAIVAFVFAAKQYKRWKKLEKQRERKIAEAIKELQVYTTKPLGDTDLSEFGKMCMKVLDMDPDIENPIVVKTSNQKMWRSIFNLVQRVYWTVRVQDLLKVNKKK